MIVRVKDYLGAIHESDYYSDEDLLASVGGNEELLAQKKLEMHEFIRDFDDLGYVGMEIDGANRYFNPKYLIWTEIDDTTTKEWKNDPKYQD